LIEFAPPRQLNRYAAVEVTDKRNILAAARVTVSSFYALG
jgi:hypothetical protein